MNVKHIIKISTFATFQQPYFGTVFMKQSLISFFNIQ